MGVKYVERENPRCFDTFKSYRSALLDREYAISIYTVHDKIEKYDCGEMIFEEHFVESGRLRVKTDNAEKFMLDNCFKSHVTLKDW